MEQWHIILAVIIFIFVLRGVFMKPELKKEEAVLMIEKGGLFIDVRSPTEYQTGHVEGALNILHTKIVEGIEASNIDKTTPLILYCASGMRSSSACTALKSAGYVAVKNAGTLKYALELAK